jgi:carbon-monoxide dehydrogenase medium subunit
LYGGVLNVHGVKGERVEPLATFFVSPGKTMLKPGDIVTSIELPAPPKGHTGVYLKHGRNKLGDLALVGVTVVAYPDKGTESEYCFKLALASVAPTPLIVEEVETILGEEVTEVRIAEAAQAAMDSCNPIDDVRSSAKYRKMMVRNLSQNALSQVWAKLKK